MIKDTLKLCYMKTFDFSKFKSLKQLLQTFKTEADCIHFLEDKLWDGKVPTSPYDPTSKVYRRGDGYYRCKNTGKNFSIRKGTFMEGSNIPLTDWFIAAYLMTSSKNGINTTQLRVYLDVSKKTVWFMLQRIRQAFVQNPTEKFDGVVEVDETYVGGKNKNRHRNKKVKHSQGRSTKDKAPVFGILQRDGKVFVKVVKNVGWKVLTGNMLRKIKAGSTIYSDEYSAYQRVFGKAKAFTHKIVVHGRGNYVNGDVHTNNIEGFWNITKDAVCGTYNHVSRKYLQRYCDEVSFRFNNRKVSKGESFCDLFANCMGTRITYKQLVTS